MKTGRWILGGARVALGAAESARFDLAVEAGRIASLETARDGARLDLGGSLILPGLINAHDHLQYSLYPRLGRGPYPDAESWARAIYRPAEPPISEQRRIPISTRLRWGAVRNLLGGCTTVAHHDPYRRTFTRDFPLRVPKLGWAHSLEFTDSVGREYRRTPRRRPFVIHFAEAAAPRESDRLERLAREGALSDRTVLVHGVALTAEDLALAAARRASLVWCPSSNHFILGASLGRAALESGLRIALGTDSALSGAADLLEEIRTAARAPVSPERLYAMVTRDAAAILRLPKGAGSIVQGGPADLVVVPDRGGTPAESLLELDAAEIQLVMVRGRIRLAAPQLRGQLPAAARRRLRRLEVEGREVWIDANLPRIYREAARVLGPELHLAGKRVRAEP